jgi:glycosyltransferase involved in cell wall biosynthesis
MKLVFVGPLQSRFVRNDVEILSREHQLVTIDAVVGRGPMALLNLAVLQLRIIRALLRADGLFFWFADYYSFFPTLVARILGKKSYVVAGGFDVWYMPELKIGARNRAGRWWLVKNTFRFCSRIFPVSKYAESMLDDSVPGHAPSRMIYNTVDTKFFTWDGQAKERSTLTVTQIDIETEYIRKGIDLFIAAAKRLPEIRFDIVGIRGVALERARADAKGLSNVNIVPAPITSEQLREYYERAASYCQLSIDETFGVAVAEGMSAGCMPVVTQAPALREVVGDVGYIVDRGLLGNVVSAIAASINSSDSDRQRVMLRAKAFDFEERARQLLAELK